MRLNKVISVFLGGAMFTFGFLKFFNPFKGWYSVQIESSQLGQMSYALGIIGELVIGMALLGLVRYRSRVSFETYMYVSIVASIAVIVMMSTGIYVHLHPNVPVDVLPLKIKPPFIPLIFLLAAFANIVILFKNRHTANV